MNMIDQFSSYGEFRVRACARAWLKQMIYHPFVVLNRLQWRAPWDGQLPR